MAELSGRQALAWLAYRAIDGGAVSEGMLAGELGIDRIDVRAMVREGKELDDRLREARLARVRAEAKDDT